MEENKNDFNFDVEDIDEVKKREKKEKKQAVAKPEGGKPNVGLIIGIAAGALVVAAAVMAICLLFGGGCEHIDADDDYLCDRCGEHFDDGDNAAVAEQVSVSFTVCVKDGGGVSGVEFVLSNSSGTYTLVSGADGNVTATLGVGRYTIAYDSDTMPEFHLATVYEADILETTSAVTLELIDNTPDGSEDKPFFLAEKVNSVTLPANTEYYYSFHGTSDAHLEVRGENITVNLDGDSYTPTDGVASIYFGDSLGTAVVFSVKNDASAAADIEISLVSRLGSRDNPIELTETSKTVVIEDGASLHYKWTATESGILVIRSTNAHNNIGLTNLTTNATAASTLGERGAYLAVNEGDSVLIAVSATVNGSEDIDFSLEVYEATETDPLPIITDSIDISLAVGAAFTFSYAFDESMTLTVSDPDITVTIGTDIKEPDSLGMIIIEGIIGEGTFTVTNTSSDRNGIQIVFD